MFEAAEIASVAGTDHVRIATVAVEQARAAHARHAERQAQADALRAARARPRARRPGRPALAQHLRANNFERWLLAEALDTLVDGASRILRELSGGQYDLGHDKGEFYVVDHHDAALRARCVRCPAVRRSRRRWPSRWRCPSSSPACPPNAASLESIVLDEGFGTLDAATLDAVAATLENLAARGDRTVGVVTHVAALADRSGSRRRDSG